MPNDLTHGFLISIPAKKGYDTAKSEFPYAGWIPVPPLDSKRAAEMLTQQWLRASVELTANIPKGVAFDLNVIRAGRARVDAAIKEMFEPGEMSLDDVVANAISELTNLAGYPPLDTLVGKQAVADAVRKF